MNFSFCKRCGEALMCTERDHCRKCCPGNRHRPCWQHPHTVDEILSPPFARLSEEAAAKRKRESHETR